MLAGTPSFFKAESIEPARMVFTCIIERDARFVSLSILS